MPGPPYFHRLLGQPQVFEENQVRIDGRQGVPMLDADPIIITCDVQRATNVLALDGPGIAVVLRVGKLLFPYEVIMLVIPLNLVLRAFEQADGPLSRARMVRDLNVSPAQLESMIAYWVRCGRIRESQSERPAEAA